LAILPEPARINVFAGPAWGTHDLSGKSFRIAGCWRETFGRADSARPRIVAIDASNVSGRVPPFGFLAVQLEGMLGRRAARSCDQWPESTANQFGNAGPAGFGGARWHHNRAARINMRRWTGRLLVSSPRRNWRRAKPSCAAGPPVIPMWWNGALRNICKQTAFPSRPSATAVHSLVAFCDGRVRDLPVRSRASSLCSRGSGRQRASYPPRLLCNLAAVKVEKRYCASWRQGPGAALFPFGSGHVCHRMRRRAGFDPISPSPFDPVRIGMDHGPRSTRGQGRTSAVKNRGRNAAPRPRLRGDRAGNHKQSGCIGKQAALGKGLPWPSRSVPRPCSCVRAKAPFRLRKAAADRARRSRARVLARPG